MNTILIIEDDTSYRKSMELILKMEGFHVSTAKDGSEGIASALANRPDLILCDIMMPILDGHSVLEQLKNNRTCSDIPFIFVTALNERADIRRGMNDGADDYLAKPFSAEELIAAVICRLRRINMLRKTNTQEYQTCMLQEITEREREILLLVGNGSTSKEISKLLGIKINTVEVHRSNLMKKLKAENAAILARWAILAELNS